MARLDLRLRISELLRGLFLLRAALSSNDLAAGKLTKTLEMDQNYVQTHRELGPTYDEKEFTERRWQNYKRLLPSRKRAQIFRQS